MTSISSKSPASDKIARKDIVSVQEILKTDSRPVPQVLLEQSPNQLSNVEIPNDIFFSQDYHDLEVEKLWKRVWQYACREEDIPNIGNYIVYDIAELSVLVVRTSEKKIQAFYNSCPHRGTQLEIEDGKAAKWQCPFHGWTWKLDGTLAHIPCRWDFDHLSDEDLRLPEVRVATLQGFVFINFANDCKPLETYLENIPAHFQNFHLPLENRFTSAWVAKVIPANWKVVLSVFLEAYHILATHPQALPFTGDINSQCDIYGRHNRMITLSAVASPHLRNQKNEQAITQSLMKNQGANPAMVKLAEGMTARTFVAEAARKKIYKQLGVDCSTVSDCQMIDTIAYFIFPNFLSLTGIGSPLQFRFRPNGNDPHSSILDVRLLQPCPAGERPPAAKINWLKSEDSWTKTLKLLGTWALSLDQDTSISARIQRGLKTSPTTISLAQYLESRVNHFHHVLKAQLEL